MTRTYSKRIDGTLYERFAPKYEVDAETGCWNWTAATNNGYGLLGKLAAHRFSYEHHVGPIPEGFEVHHRCENRGCVNPEHLQAVTRDEHARLSRRARLTHCKRGHPLVSENLLAGRRWRHCKRCHRERMHAVRNGYVRV